ncbi:MAG: uL15 family ribosomal protein [Candidatus Shapirobacteria bacterium]
MTLLSNLTPIIAKSQKRVGRGIGSGKGGHTTGRGQKGDKARGKTKATFEGSKIKKSWIKRLPFLRGKHRVLPQKDGLVVINLIAVNRLSPKTIIEPAVYKAKYLKILGQGNITSPYHFRDVIVTATVRTKIEAAGGKID